MADFTLTTGRLRPWRLSDAPSLARYANNRKISRNLLDSFPYPYSEDDARAWLERIVRSSPQTEFAVEMAGEAVGGIGLLLQSDIARLSAEIGYFLGEEYWGLGIMTDAVRTVTQYGFSKLGLVRIYALVLDWNTASVRVLEKSSYQLEGRLRMAAIKDGQIVDRFLYSCIREP